MHRSHRTIRLVLLLGVVALATALNGTPVMARPKAPIPLADRAAARSGGVALPAGFADWDAVYAYQTRLNAAANQILAADAGGNASIVAAPDAHHLQVYWKGDVPADVRALAGRLDVPVVFTPALYTHATLVSEARRLATDPRVLDVAPKADGSGLAVTADRDDTAMVAATAAPTLTGPAGLAVAGRVPLTVTAGTRPGMAFGRQQDTPLFWGGARYFTAGSCTNGIPVKVSNVYRMMSAGHCGNNGDAANISGQPQPTGTIFSKDACRDTLLIDYPSGVAPRIYTGDKDSSTSTEVLGATSDFVGNLVATGGATSGEHTNIKVVQVDLFYTPANSACTTGPTGPLIKAQYDTKTCATAKGDSGAPVYSYVGSDVLARGTVHGGNFNTASCPGAADADSSRTLLYAPLFRPAGDQEVGSLDFYRATPPPATVFDLNGRWNGGGVTGPFITVNETSISVDMSSFGRPTARGSVLTTGSISVTFPDDATYTGILVSPNTIRWSNNTTWTKVAPPTIFDLTGRWTDGRGPGPFIRQNSTNLSVDMSANHRPTASGLVLNSSTIQVTFPDDATFTGRLVAPNTIIWSNNTMWLKL